jgi:hypothetical protein
MRKRLNYGSENNLGWTTLVCSHNQGTKIQAKMDFLLIRLGLTILNFPFISGELTDNSNEENPFMLNAVSRSTESVMWIL